MSDQDSNPSDTFTDAHRALWHAKASRQGLVCLICGRPPKLERRPAFYDTGLCLACDTELAGESAPDSL